MTESAARLGDKVRIRQGSNKGARGRVEEVMDESIVVRLDSGDPVITSFRDVTNYSLAARRAWQAMPSRSVGRPRAPDTASKRTVSIRIDIEVWRQLGEAAEKKLIPSREQAVNEWLREKVDALLTPGKDPL